MGWIVELYAIFIRHNIGSVSHCLKSLPEGDNYSCLCKDMLDNMHCFSARMEHPVGQKEWIF